MARRLAIRMPPWADRLALAAIGAWLVAMALARGFQGLDLALRGPFGTMPDDLEMGVNLLGLMLPGTFMLLGPALWEDPTKRPRFLVACGFADLWLLTLVGQQLLGNAADATVLLLLANLQSALLLGAAGALAWTTQRARILVALGATATIASIALLAATSEGAPWLAGIELQTEVSVWTLRALAVGAVGLALALPGRRRLSPGGRDPTSAPQPLMIR